MTYLIKATNVYRVDSVNEALHLREELEKMMPCELSSFKYTHKDVKVKGEIVDSYELVSATLVFQSEKEPDNYARESYGSDEDYND